MSRDAAWRDESEIARFNAMARQWWDPNGPMKPLHRLNPTRLAFFRAEAARHFGRDARSLRPFEGLSLLDIGCGAGLVTEPMARMGFDVSGIDPAEENIAIAGDHAAKGGLSIRYRAMTVEALPAGERHDVVTLLEVVEHVPDVGAMVAAAAKHLKPGGLFIGSTINRTLKAFGLAILGAEYVLRWVPRGTHSYEKFVTPDEFEDHLAAAGLEPMTRQGMVFNPLTNQWALANDTDVNYFVTARKPG
ncbi:MAG: bifunctional 2-polyprenyl-6-hydroxyphenol methylase/3-demethylubiquinol 3-O-methyltransferase UbiG [Methylobacterium sp.]|nr:bifunctional 2-polyprenyl-6-hydroxyphenol methylase/3-demethylubiquinol 3-O-methyltransferase UbiG [Methylobacterium sp.]MCA3652818.1 bifunctional 2-polyprenyl-6-hydroxyphenol methylase/3-demethylubiquinol 3-O-methyltransferase UbiG [Methylobacterium sp.]MCA4924507.1 bifunctional 2-polyprenyl-6-hydroxyphenol methylase/3-demethylubiquinol 3-O-methyltransferase UbiG [Methylobacterium sp.]